MDKLPYFLYVCKAPFFPSPFFLNAAKGVDMSKRENTPCLFALTPFRMGGIVETFKNWTSAPG
jgi:hypothetical protein